MFTGIIQEIGTVSSINTGSGSAEISVKAEKVLAGIKPGDSIAVNGVCITVTSFISSGFTAALSPETMQKTNFARLKAGDKCNLEKAITAGEAFGGHFLTGHIDGTGEISSSMIKGNSVVLKIKAPNRIMKYIASKGSVALDGVSLTPFDSTDHDFSVSIVPHTLENTILKNRKKGDSVNIECDILCKYIERLINVEKQAQEAGKKSKINREYLKETGFLI